MIALGVPIGSTEWTVQQLKHRFDSFTSNIKKCAETSPTQVTLTMLRNTASAYQHIIAVLPPTETTGFAKNIDHANLLIFKKYVLEDEAMDAVTWRNMKSRLKMRARQGGFGMLSLADRVNAAFVRTHAVIQQEHEEYDKRSKMIANVLSSSDAMKQMVEDVTEEIVQWHKDNGGGDIRTKVDQMTLRELTNQSIEQHAHHYASTCNPQQLKALKASQERGANDVITVRPNREETTLSDNEMNFAVRQRLACLGNILKCPEEQEACHACSATTITSEHFASCGYNRKKRHDDVVFTHYEALEMAGVTATMERQLPNGNMKIDLFYLDPSPQVANERYVMADPTIIQAYDNNSNALPDTKKNLEKAAKVKIQKYRDAATDWRARVQPLPYTTFGATSRYTTKWLTDVEAAAKNNAQYFPELDRKFSVVWRENISFSIARETAKAAFEASAHHQTLMDLAQDTLE